MIYDQKKLKGLIRNIGMNKTFGYLIEGRGSEKIYKYLGVEKKPEKHYYSLVAESITEVVDSEGFRKKARPSRKDVKYKRGIITRKRTVTLSPEKYAETKGKLLPVDFSDQDIEIFKRYFGLGYKVGESLGSLSKRILKKEGGIKNMSKLLLKNLIPEIKLMEEKEVEFIIEDAVKILRNGKDSSIPGQYRSEIWRKFHEKLTI